MAYYAILNSQSVVTSVFPGKDNGQDGVANWEAEYSKITGKTCKATSYTGSFRKNFAGVGFTYDQARDAFIAPRPEPANFYTLNETTCRWQMTPEGQQFYITEAVKNHLDFIVFSQRQYDNIGSCISYETDPDPLWAAEAVAAKVWRSAVWKKVIEIQQQVQSGQRPIPTPTEVIAELPVIQWPPA